MVSNVLSNNNKCFYDIHSKDNKLCILTPTYNRAYTLPRLYESLKRQKDKDFVWIIVDDGSTDKTATVVSSWIKSKDIQILYLQKENGGKHTAINYAMPYIKSEYTFIVDSDDYIIDNAVILIKNWIEECRGIKNLAGISGTRRKPSNKKEIIGGFPENKKRILASNFERHKYNLLGDKAEIYKTELLKLYPFPEFEGEKFLAEGVVWNHIAYDGYKVMWYPDSLVICEYLEDGLTKADKQIQFKSNLNGFILNYQYLWKGYSGLLKYRAIIPFYDQLHALGMASSIRRYLDLRYYEYLIIKTLSMIKKIFLK